MKTAQQILTSNEKFNIHLGLQRIRLVLALLNNPQNNYKIIHIAGTNGKGSTCKIVNQILVEHFKNTNKKIGLFTSPHLFSYCERIKVNNIDIKEEIFDRLINDIDNFAISHNIKLSEFELLTTVALYYFYIQRVDYVILEVGLGGKYDATNIVNPIISAITTIDYDHTERLGNTINKIALQKAGIIKENSKVVVSKNNLGYETISKVAKIKKSTLLTPKQDIKIEFINDKNYAIINDEKMEFSLLGKHQKENLSLALEIIKNIDLSIKKTTVKNALKNLNWKFRLEYHKDKKLLIDGAHNPSGIRTLRNFLDENFKNEHKIFLFGCLKNKDYKTMLDILLKENDELYFIEFNHLNSLKFSELGKKYNAKLITNINKFMDENKNDIKVACGSLYMLGEIFNNY